MTNQPPYVTIGGAGGLSPQTPEALVDHPIRGLHPSNKGQRHMARWCEDCGQTSHTPRCEDCRRAELRERELDRYDEQDEAE